MLLSKVRRELAVAPIRSEAIFGDGKRLSPPGVSRGAPDALRLEKRLAEAGADWVREKDRSLSVVRRRIGRSGPAVVRRGDGV